MVDARQSSAQVRALILSKAIKRRDDVRILTLIEEFAGDWDYQGCGLENMAVRVVLQLAPARNRAAPLLRDFNRNMDEQDAFFVLNILSIPV